MIDMHRCTCSCLLELPQNSQHLVPRFLPLHSLKSTTSHILGQWAPSNSSCPLYILLFASVNLLAGLHFHDGSKTSIIISPSRKFFRPFLVGLIAICPSYVARLDIAVMIGRWLDAHLIFWCSTYNIYSQNMYIVQATV